MAFFKINEPNKPAKWIKSIDRANGKLEFSQNREECFQQDGGFFANSEAAYLKFHFMEEYPELKYMEIDESYEFWSDAFDAPNEPNEQAPNAIGADVAELRAYTIGEMGADAITNLVNVGANTIGEADGIAEELREADLPQWAY